MPRHALRLAVLLTSLALGSTALAHDPWESNALALHPNAPNELVLRTNRGVAVSSDGGETWHFLCRVIMNPTTLTVGVTSTGRALLGTFNDLSTMDRNGCDVRTLESPMSGLWVADLQQDPTNARAWYATTARGGEHNGVFRSPDDGQTWQLLGNAELGPFFKQIRVTRNGQRLYLGVAEYFAPTDTTPERVDYSVRYSDDQGQNWTSFPVTLEHDDKEMVLLDVDPTNPDRIFIGIHVCREDNRCYDPARGPRNDRVLVSNDRGETWQEFFQVEEIASFEINDEYVWVGDWWQGFWRMKPDGTEVRELDRLLKPGCIIARDNELLVCGTDVFGALLLRSTDDGETLTPWVSSESVLGNPVCAPDDTDGGVNIVAACRDEWGDLCNESFYDDPNPPLECAGQILRDGGMDGGQDPGKGRGGGCACQAAGTSPTQGGRAWVGGFGLLAIAWLTNRRQKKVRARTRR